MRFADLHDLPRGSHCSRLRSLPRRTGCPVRKTTPSQVRRSVTRAVAGAFLRADHGRHKGADGDGPRGEQPHEQRGDCPRQAPPSGSPDGAGREQDGDADERSVRHVEAAQGAPILRVGVGVGVRLPRPPDSSGESAGTQPEEPRGPDSWLARPSGGNSSGHPSHAARQLLTVRLKGSAEPALDRLGIRTIGQIDVREYGRQLAAPRIGPVEGPPGGVRARARAARSPLLPHCLPSTGQGTVPAAVAAVVAQDDLPARTKAPQPTDPHAHPVWAPVVISPGTPRRRRRRGQTDHARSVRRLSSGQALPSADRPCRRRPPVKAESQRRPPVGSSGGLDSRPPSKGPAAVRASLGPDA
jgi:hypothetical protein